MDILKKIITSNDKRIILLQPDSRNNNSLSKINRTCKPNNTNNNIIYYNTGYAKIQNSKIKLRKNIPINKMNISFCKKTNNDNNNDPKKECRLISYIDLGNNNKIKKFSKNKKDVSSDSKYNRNFKKDLIINNNITNNISNHITNIILTNNNSRREQKNNNLKKSNRTEKENLDKYKNNENQNNYMDKNNNKKRIIINNFYEKNNIKYIKDLKSNLASRNLKKDIDNKGIKTNCNKNQLDINNKNSREYKNKTKNITERNKKDIKTYFTSYINSCSNLHINTNRNNKNNKNILIKNQNKKSLNECGSKTKNIEFSLHSKKLNNSNNFKNKLTEYNIYNSNSKKNLILFNKNNNNINQVLKTYRNSNKKIIFSKIQKNKQKINLNDLKNMNQMRALFVKRISNSNNKNESLVEKNSHNLSYINCSVILRRNHKDNNYRKKNNTLFCFESKSLSKIKSKKSEISKYKNNNKNKIEIINNIYKNFKTDRSVGNSNNLYTNDDSSNINIINIINNYNQKNIPYNKSFLLNNTDILKNKTIKLQKRKISLHFNKNIKKNFLSNSLKKNFGLTNSFISYRNDNYNSYKELYLYNKANSYRNISNISKDKETKNYSKQKKPKYYSNQKKIHNNKIIKNRNKNRCKKENICPTEFNIHKNGLINLINLRKGHILKKDILKKNLKSIQNDSKGAKGAYTLNKSKCEINKRNHININYNKENNSSTQIQIDAIKTILDMNSKHFSPKQSIKKNIIKNYNMNNNIKLMNGLYLIKQNKSVRMSCPFNNVTSLNKKKKIKIEEIMNNKEKFNNNKLNNKNKKEKKNNKILYNKLYITKNYKRSKTNQNLTTTQIKTESTINKKDNNEHEDIININPVIKNNPQYSSEYLYDMIENFLLDEELYISKNYINPNYLSYNDKINNDNDNNILFTSDIRNISINWLTMIIYKIFKFKENTLYLTVQIIDRFLSKKMLSIEKSELLILCSLILCSKHEEIDYVNMIESLQLSSNKFTKKEIINMQYEILNELNFELMIPTMNDYFSIFCVILNFKEIDINKGLLLLNIILVDYYIIKYPNFMIALAVIKLLNKQNIDPIINIIRNFCIKNNQKKFLEIINDIKYLEKICYKIKKIYKSYINDKYPNIEEKFLDEKYNSVAKFSSKLIDISDL